MLQRGKRMIYSGEYMTASEIDLLVVSMFFWCDALQYPSTFDSNIFMLSFLFDSIQIRNNIGFWGKLNHFKCFSSWKIFLQSHSINYKNFMPQIHLLRL